jgi:hypothetical protein
MKNENDIKQSTIEKPGVHTGKKVDYSKLKRDTMAAGQEKTVTWVLTEEKAQDILTSLIITERHHRKMIHEFSGITGMGEIIQQASRLNDLRIELQNL